MSRLGMLYAITDEELKDLKKQPKESMYHYMLEKIEEDYLGTERACEINKAWDGIQYCLNSGVWNESDSTPSNIILGGEFLLDHNDHLITLKTPTNIKQIVEYLENNDLKTIINSNYEKIDAEEYELPKDDDNREFLLEWSDGIKEFYEYSLENKFNVIFTVDI